jgi:membrane protease YdiL (CAAX protease family)
LPPPSAPAGWYADPWQAGEMRWWDGAGWTHHHAPAHEVGPLPTLPWRAGVLGILLSATAAVVAGVFASLVGHLARRSLSTTQWGFLWPVVLALLVLMVYGPMVWWARYCSRRWGSGSLRRDVGFEFRLVDLGWGLLVAVGSYIALIAVAMVIAATHLPTTTSTRDLVGERHTVVLVFAAIGVLVAPVVEELFFRGVLLRSFRSRLAPAPAIAAQAVVFGMYHISLAFGWGNLGLVLSISALGAVFGVAAHQLRRLAPGMVAHAIVNTVAFITILVSSR